MYPVRLGYNEASSRIRILFDNGHYSEALVTSVFTVEKTLRRTLKQLVVSAGFRSKIANKIMKGFRGLEAIKSAWETYDPVHRHLTEVILENDWRIVKKASVMRNKMIHGEQVFDQLTCKEETVQVLAALNNINSTLNQEYGYSGWERVATRAKSNLHNDPKVTI